ncbi:MAG: GDSL family lipase [Lachnospiraceae bacterium]|nr:GDSL family lipase [Lachnospiraceae bacterium]
MKFYATDERVITEGRIFTDGNVKYLGWSGSRVTFKFSGTRASVRVKSDAGAMDEHIYARVAVFLNNAEKPSEVVMLTDDETTLVLFESKTCKTVTITLMKYSEAAFGYCGIEYFEIDGFLEKPDVRKRRKIEFIGDSITCGYGVEAENELCDFRTDTENPTKSYSLKLAGALDAEVNMVCWSGNGIISKWVEETATEPLTDDLMPVLYPYTDLSLCKRLYGDNEEKYEKWDFSSYVPELIIINLGTNDCSWCKDIPERKLEFKRLYVDFLAKVREYNPKAKIVSVFGTMDDRLTKEIEAAVEERKAADDNVFFIDLPMQDSADGMGANYHPSATTHRKTAEFLLAKLKDMNIV